MPYFYIIGWSIFKSSLLLQPLFRDETLSLCLSLVSLPLLLPPHPPPAIKVPDDFMSFALPIYGLFFQVFCNHLTWRKVQSLFQSSISWACSLHVLFTTQRNLPCKAHLKVVHTVSAVPPVSALLPAVP